MAAVLNAFASPVILPNATALFQAETFHHYNHPDTNIIGIRPTTAGYLTNKPGPLIPGTFSLDARHFPTSGLEDDNGRGIWTIFMENTGRVIPLMQFPEGRIDYQQAIGTGTYRIPAQYEGYSYLFNAALADEDEQNDRRQVDLHVTNMARYAETFLPKTLVPNHWTDFSFELNVPPESVKLFQELKQQNKELEFHVATTGMIAALVKASGLRLSTDLRRMNNMCHPIDYRGMQRVF